MKIVVIGGTGLIGSKLVAKLKQQGHDAVAGLAQVRRECRDRGRPRLAVLAGADVVVDVANAPSWEPAAVLEFFQRSSKNLVAAGSQLRASSTTSRCRSWGPTARPTSPISVPSSPRRPSSRPLRSPTRSCAPPSSSNSSAPSAKRVRLAARSSSHRPMFQPIAADDVADRLAEVATGRPLNGTIDLAGPEKAPFNEFVARRLKAAGRQPVRWSETRLRSTYGAPIDDTSLNPLGDATAREDRRSQHGSRRSEVSIPS